MSEELLLNLKIDSGNNQQTLDKLTASIGQQKLEIKQLTENISLLTAAEGVNSQSVIDLTKQRSSLQDSVKVQTNLQKALQVVEDNEEHSLTSLIAQNKALKIQRDAVSTSTLEGRQKIVEFNKAMDENHKAIVAQSSDFEKQEFNIGNYVKELNIAGVSLGALSGGFKNAIATGNPLLAIAPVVGKLFEVIQDSPLVKGISEAVNNSFEKLFGITKETTAEIKEQSYLIEASYSSLYAMEADYQNDITRFRSQEGRVGLQKTIDDEKRAYVTRLSAAKAFYSSLLEEQKQVLSTTRSEIDNLAYALRVSISDAFKEEGKDATAEELKKTDEIIKRIKNNEIFASTNIIKNTIGVTDDELKGIINAIKQFQSANLSYVKSEADYAKQLADALKQIEKLGKPKTALDFLPKEPKFDPNEGIEELYKSDIDKILESQRVRTNMAKETYTEELKFDQDLYNYKLKSINTEVTDIVKKNKAISDLNTKFKVDLINDEKKYQDDIYDVQKKSLKEQLELLKIYGKSTAQIESQLVELELNHAKNTTNSTTQSNDAKKESNDGYFKAYSNSLGAFSAAYQSNVEAYRVTASGKAVVDTYSAADAAFAEAGGFPYGIVPMLLSIAAGLANVAVINGVALAGGGDFVTTKPTLLLVGDNPGGRERVRVDPISGVGQTRTFGTPNVDWGSMGIAMAGGGSLEVNNIAKSSVAATKIGRAVKETKIVMVVQDFELAQAKKNSPIQRAAILAS